MRNRDDVMTGIFVLALFVLLIGGAAFWPSNALTGYVVSEECTTCLEMCDDDAQCSSGVCCPTAWETGVCGTPASCERIMEASRYQSLETYEENAKDPPPAVHVGSVRFWMPLAFVVLAIVVFAVLPRRRQ